MTRGTSSAVPEELIRYSLRAVQIDNELVSESHRLSRALDSFERTCRERQFRVHVSHLDDALRSYASETENTDRWVRTVGLGFQEADRRAWIERLGNAAIGRVVTLPWTGGNAAVTAILEPGWTLWRLIHPEHRAVLEVAAIAAPGFMIALKAIELARDAVAEVKEGVTWVRGEGIR
ncbi:MAG: hypothetical protein L6435_14440, partial [Anaerolineae bacterium]|nr:hypothetical protein [Anaerolineae bacterium]